MSKVYNCEQGDCDMPKVYVFEFRGTKEEFLNNLNQFRNNTTYADGTFYYLDDYIVKLVGDEIHFGIARGGHSGGYWFLPTIISFDDRIEFRGTILYIVPGSEKRGVFKKAIDCIEIFILTVLFFPIILVIRGYMFIEWLVRKIISRPKPKQKTDEERLLDLMENYVGCVAK